MWVGDRTLPAITAMPVGEACEYAAGLSLTGRRGEIAAKILKEIRDRLQFLVNVGLDYLTSTAAPTPCPAAKPSASAWPARSAPAWWE